MLSKVNPTNEKNIDVATATRNLVNLPKDCRNVVESIL